MVAVHIVSPIWPMTTNRGSSMARAGTSTRSVSDQSACASSKSIPCLALFAADFAGSNSNGIQYSKYTIIDHCPRAAASVGHGSETPQTGLTRGRGREEKNRRIGFVTGQGPAGGHQDLAVATHVQHLRLESVRSSC